MSPRQITIITSERENRSFLEQLETLYDKRDPRYAVKSSSPTKMSEGGKQSRQQVIPKAIKRSLRNQPSPWGENQDLLLPKKIICNLAPSQQSVRQKVEKLNSSKGVVKPGTRDSVRNVAKPMSSQNAVMTSAELVFDDMITPRWRHRVTQ